MADLIDKKLTSYRYALAIKTLLDRNKKIKEKNKKKGIEDPSLDQSYAEISSSTGLRPATISNILTGKSEVKSFTLYQIISTLGFSFVQFGRVFDKLTKEDIIEYINKLELGRTQTKKPKSKK